MHTHSPFVSSSKPAAAPAERREVGFKGLLDVCMRASLTTTHMPLSYPLSGHVEVVGTAHSTPPVRRLVKSVVQGIRACQDPEASSEGLGGTYFFKNEEGCKVAIMKPCDEEPLAPNNPKVGPHASALCKASAQTVTSRHAQLKHTTHCHLGTITIHKYRCFRHGLEIDHSMHRQLH